MKRRHSLPKKRTLWFSAEGQAGCGKIKHFRVYREGSTIEIVGPNLSPHPCHPSRKDREGVEREIALVFNVKVTKVELPTRP